jgi:hypothetical protein
MTREQELRARMQARQAALCDVSFGREPTAERAAWWVGELSHELCIVDARGMIDVDGPVARFFTREYRRIYRNTPRGIGVG